MYVPHLGLCECLDEGNSYYFNGKICSVNEGMSCDVNNVINVITYNGCRHVTPILCILLRIFIVFKARVDNQLECLFFF